MYRKFFQLFHRQNEEEEENEIGLGPINETKLKSLKKYIIKKEYDSFEEFTNYYTKNSTHSQCAVSWCHRALACRCKQCQMTSNSCVCIKCFIEGPHKHHECNIHLTALGSCDCGDPSGWKPEGFCKLHQCKKQKDAENQETNTNNTDNENDDDYLISDNQFRKYYIQQEDNEFANLSTQLKERLTTAFQVVKKDMEKMFINNNFRYFSECCKFFLEFTTLGDEIRSCVCENLNDNNFLKNAILQAQYLDKYKMNDFFQLSGALCSDHNFSVPFTYACSQAIPELIDIIKRSAVLAFTNRNAIPISGIEVVLNFGFQYFSLYPLKILISQDKFDWIGFILKLNDAISDFVLQEENIYSVVNFEPILGFVSSYNYILRVVFHLESEKPKMKHFVIEFCKSLEKFEGFVPSQLNDHTQIYDNFKYTLSLSNLPYKLMKNMPYFVPEINDIFVYYLLHRKPFNEDKMRNYSLAILLHQIFISNLLIFNRKNEFKSTKITEQTTAKPDNSDDNEDIRKIIFDDCYNGKDPQETFEYYCRKNLFKINQIQINTSKENIKELINDIYMKAIDLPMTLIAAHFLLHFKQHQFTTYPRYCSECIISTHSHCFFQSYILSKLFSLVQVMFSFADKDMKDDMLKKITKYFGAIDTKYVESSKKMRDFSFIIFLSTLILDRDGINNDIENICLKNLMTEMKYTNVGTTEINNIIIPCKMSKKRFKKMYESMNIENDWNIVIPYYNKINELYDRVLPAIIEKTQDTLLQFPEFADPSIGDDNNELNICPNLLIKRLPEVFESKYLFSIIYYFIYEYNSDPIITQYALNLFITFAENSKANDDDKEIQSIAARDLDELTLNIQTNNFRIFAKTKVLFKGNQGISLVQLVNDLGVMGMSALRRVGLSIINVKKPMKKIIKLKRTISRSLMRSSQKFESTIDRRTHDCCSICHKVFCTSKNDQENPIKDKFDSEMLYIPVSEFKSVSTDLIDSFIHGKLTRHSNFKNKHFIRRHPKYKYVHLNCFINSSNHSDYFLMPKIDLLPFNILADENAEEEEENETKSLAPFSKSNSKNTLQITTNQNNNDRLNFNININFGNITINGVPLNLNDNNDGDINIDLNNDENNGMPLRFLSNISSRNNASLSSLNHNDAKDNVKSTQSFLLNSIFNFLSFNNFYSNSLEVLSQMILVLDHRSRLIPEVLDDQMVLSLYSNLFKVCIYLFYLKDKDIKLSLQVHDQLDAVLLECLKLKAPKKQTKAYQLMMNAEKKEYDSLISENKEEYKTTSFDAFYFSKIVQQKADVLDEKDEKINTERLHEFLRRCYLIEKFYLCDKSDVSDLFIDWDMYLDFNVLYNHFYHKKFPKDEQSTLPVYRGIELPHNFFELLYPPFNVNFNDINANSSICLFSGAMANDGFFSIQRLPAHGMPFTVALNVSDDYISSINFLSKNAHSSRRLNSIYVDKNGYQDPGFVRGDILTLSVEKYNQLIDDFLSGNILG